MRRLPTLCCWAIILFGCRGPAAPPPDTAARDSLLLEVETLRRAMADRLRDDPIFQVARGDTGHVMIGVNSAFLEQALQQATSVYLDTVRLHIEPDVVVEEGDQVRVRIGPIRITAGSWQLRVTIHRIEALLLARSIEMSVADSSSVALDIGVETREGAGNATIDFEWDASTVASAVCGDFEVHETFDGVVAPREYDVQAAFRFHSDGRNVVADPEWTGERLRVSPQPTEASWARVREILARQNHIFRCGIALKPESMEQMLRDLLTRGFAFDLPESILRPIPLPAAISEDVTVAGRQYAVAAFPLRVWLTPEGLWYSAIVDVGTGDDGTPDSVADTERGTEGEP